VQAGLNLFHPTISPLSKESVFFRIAAQFLGKGGVRRDFGEAGIEDVME
jgi:hypothetical protein